MMIISNSNGKKYDVLDTYGQYMLLHNLSWVRGGDRYAVIYNLYPDLKGWQQGYYYENLESAMEYFRTISTGYKSKNTMVESSQ
jgi:hypothetical protein